MKKILAYLGVAGSLFTVDSGFGMDGCFDYLTSSSLRFSGLKAIGNISCSGMELSWDAAADAKFYAIYEMISEKPKLLAMTPSTSTSYVLPAQSAGTHYYRVRALDAFGLPDSNNVDVPAVVPSTCSANSYKNLILGDRPSVYWRLAETSSLSAATDSSGNRTIGYFSTTGVTYNSTGILPLVESDPAASFDGATGKFSFSCLSTITNTFTLEAWVKPSTTTFLPASETSSGAITLSNHRPVFMSDPGGCSLSASDAGAGLLVGTNGIAVIEHSPGYFPALSLYTATISPSSWHHVAVVYANKTPTLYFDGVNVRSNFSSGKTNVYPPIYIGWGAYGSYQGGIDEVAIYNYALSAEQILSHYQAGSK